MPGERGVLARHAVDEDVQAPVVVLDLREQAPDLRLCSVIDPDRDPGPASGRNQIGRLLDGLRPLVRRGAAAYAPPRTVDGRPGLAQAAGDAPAGAVDAFRRPDRRGDFAERPGRNGPRRVGEIRVVENVVGLNAEIERGPLRIGRLRERLVSMSK